jgi:hypothetical protein
MMFDSPEKRQLRALQDLERQRQQNEQLQANCNFVFSVMRSNIEARNAARSRRRQEARNFYAEIASLPDIVSLIRYLHVALERAIIERLPYDLQIEFCDKAIDIFYQTHGALMRAMRKPSCVMKYVISPRVGCL